MTKNAQNIINAARIKEIPIEDEYNTDMYSQDLDQNLLYILRDEFFIHFTGLLVQFLALNSSLDLWRKWSNLGKLNDNLVFFILFSSCLEALFVLILLRAIHKL